MSHKLIALLLLLAATPRVSFAAEADSKIAARNLYLEGRRLYDVGEYQSSLSAFKKAYLRYEDSSFLFNIGQCHRQLGQEREALQAYRSYLRRTPDADNRSEVQRLITQLEGAIAQEAAAAKGSSNIGSVATTPEPTARRNVVVPVGPATPAPASVAPLVAHVEQHTSIARKWWLWTTIVGVAAVGVGVGVGVYYGTHRFSPTLSSFGPGSALSVRF